MCVCWVLRTACLASCGFVDNVLFNKIFLNLVLIGTRSFALRLLIFRSLAERKKQQKMVCQDAQRNKTTVSMSTYMRAYIPHMLPYRPHRPATKTRV